VLQFVHWAAGLREMRNKMYIFSSAKFDNKYVNYPDTSMFIQKSSYMFDVHRAVHRNIFL